MSGAEDLRVALRNLLASAMDAVAVGSQVGSQRDPLLDDLMVQIERYANYRVADELLNAAVHGKAWAARQGLRIAEEAKS